jgi:PHD-finger
MANTCFACILSDDSVSMDNLLSCQGCGNSFHNSCVDIDDIIYEAIQRSKNLYWKCDGCAGPKLTGDPTEMIMKKLDAMSADIETLKLRQPPPKKLLSGLFTPRKAEAVAATPASKRKRVETSASTPALTHVTGTACHDLVAIKPLKWLYVSMLHPSTTMEI